MHVIKARNPHQALPEVLRQLQQCGIESDSRNGTVLRFPEPTTICYTRPLERVVFWAERDANPFFHLLEAVWMLAGRNDTKFPTSIVSSMGQFSDDGRTFNGAYGQRWRSWFDRDQIIKIGRALRANPECRRQVLSMWDPRHDPGQVESGTKDVPCNTHIYFSLNEAGKLDMTVCNRSNDIVWGALGANAVHMSILHEVVAQIAMLEVGMYRQMSQNMHLYTKQHGSLIEAMVGYTELVSNPDATMGVAQPILIPMFQPGCPYHRGVVNHTNICTLVDHEEVEQLLSEVGSFIDLENTMGVRSWFLRRVAGPMLQAYRYYQGHDAPSRYIGAISILREALSQSPNNDWLMAGADWMQRRLEKHKEKSDAN